MDELSLIHEGEKSTIYHLIFILFQAIEATIFLHLEKSLHSPHTLLIEELLTFCGII